MRLVEGFGINDFEGKSTGLVSYSRWRKMLYRCYSKSYLTKNPSYNGCTVCEEWKYFSNFKAWMETQNYEGKDLDKDLLVKGNKLYSPETCCFISREINSFMTESNKRRGDLPIGVSFKKSVGKFMARCNDGNKRMVFLGYHKTPEDGHKAWLEYKLKLATELSKTIEDPKIAEALIKRYSSY